MKWANLAIPLIILIEIVTFVSFFKWHNESVYEFEQRQLDLQVNYAIDAAAQEMLESSTNVDTDEANWGAITMEPGLALNIFQTVMLKNLGWSVSDQNKENFMLDMCPFFIVAGYDGYYVYSQNPEYIGVDGNNDGVYDDVNDDGVVDYNDYTIASYPHRWTPKIPYAELIDDTMYFYNLGSTYYGTMVRGATSSIKYNNKIIESYESLPGTSARASIVVNTKLTDACNEALVWGLADRGGASQAWYLPTGYTTWTSSNPINSPSLLAYVQASGLTNYNSATFGIEGAKVAEAEFCVCYERNGQPMYTYAVNRDIIDAEGLTVISVVPTPTNAAKLGYYYDTKFIQGGNLNAN
ncbi:MAG: hypothetical protein IKL53_06665 [Lachnospiraceae bacterium]|nr:hypothetical protein [Lachnospiraceae bacterium]